MRMEGGSHIFLRNLNNLVDIAVLFCLTSHLSLLPVCSSIKTHKSQLLYRIEEQQIVHEDAYTSYVRFISFRFWKKGVLLSIPLVCSLFYLVIIIFSLPTTCVCCVWVCWVCVRALFKSTSCCLSPGPSTSSLPLAHKQLSLPQTAQRPAEVNKWSPHGSAWGSHRGGRGQEVPGCIVWREVLAIIEQQGKEAGGRGYCCRCFYNLLFDSLSRACLFVFL